MQSIGVVGRVAGARVKRYIENIAWKQTGRNLELLDFATTDVAGNRICPQNANRNKIAGLTIPGHFKHERYLRQIEGVNQLVMDGHRKGAIPRIGSIEIQRELIGAVRGAGTREHGNVGHFTRAKRQTGWCNKLILFATMIVRQITGANANIVEYQSIPGEAVEV